MMNILLTLTITFLILGGLCTIMPLMFSFEYMTSKQFFRLFNIGLCFLGLAMVLSFFVDLERRSQSKNDEFKHNVIERYNELTNSLSTNTNTKTITKP